MSGSQSSLFAGMHFGKGTKTITPTSSDQNIAEPKCSERKQSKDDKVERLESSGRTGGSSFSFIKQNETVKQTNTGSPSIVVADKTSLLESLDLFETLDGDDSIPADDDKLLSYSDQLAEILPMSTPVDDTFLSMSGSFATTESNDIEDTLEDDCKDVYKDFSSEDAEEEEEETIIICDLIGDSNNDSKVEDNSKDEGDSKNYSKDEVETMEDTDTYVKDSEVAKYNLVLEPEDKLSLFNTQYAFELTKLRNEKEEFQRNLSLVYEDAKNQIISLEKKLSDLKIKFDEVLSNDDYDSAAEINEKIEQLTTEKYELQSTRTGLLNSKVREYLNHANDFMEKEISFHNWALSKYNDLQSEQNKLLTEHREKCAKQLDTKEQDIKSQKDEVTRTLQHLQLDKEHMKADRTQLDTKINAKLKIFQDKKDELVAKQRCLEGEIEKLEQRLEELKSESKQIGFALQKEEDKMDEAREEFEPLETKLKKENDQIQSKEEMLKAKLKQFELQEKDVEATAIQNKEREESLLESITHLVAKRTESEALVQSCQKETDTKILDVFLPEPTEEEETSNLKNLITFEKEKSTELQDLELEVFNKEQKITMMKKRLDEIKSKVPELEKGKKMAATERNFKEAKRLNEIVKQLTTEGETTETEVHEMENNLKEETKKVAALKEEYGKLKNDVVTAKENHDRQLFTTVVNRIMLLAVKEEESDSIREILRDAELDLLQTEFTYLDVPSESVISEMSNVDQQNLAFVKEFVKLEDGPENIPGYEKDSESEDDIA